MLLPVPGRAETVCFMKSLIKQRDVRIAAFMGELLDRLFRIREKSDGALQADICKAGMGGDAQLGLHAFIDIFHGIMKAGGQGLRGNML